MITDNIIYVENIDIPEYYGIIYIIRNKINNKVYVGQTTKSFEERYNYGLEKHHNAHLRNSIKKYGLESFEIIKEYDIAYSKEQLNYLESVYIDYFNSTNVKLGYNKRDGGSNGKLSEETKRKISKRTKEAMTSAVKQKISEVHSGKTLSEETKRKMSESHSNENHHMYGKNHSEETKRKISESRCKSVIQLTKNCEFVNKYNSATDASQQTSIHLSNITECCRGGRKAAGGSIWMYESDYIDLLNYAF